MKNDLQEKIRIKDLENQTLKLLRTSRWGQIYAIIYFVVGLISIYIYNAFLELNLFLSIVLGLVTWFVVAFIFDTILIKTQRIDKQLKWMINTPDGIEELKSKGMTDEQIQKIRDNFDKLEL